MKLNIRKNGYAESRTIEGAEARALLKETLRDIAQSILMPIPPFTGKIRRRAIEALRNGQPLYTTTTDHGQPTGDMITMPPKIVGIIKQDGTYESVDGTPDPRLSQGEPAPVSQDEVLAGAGGGTVPDKAQ